MAKSYKGIAIKYAKDSKEANVGAEVKLACERFLQDLKREDLELHTKEPDFVIGIIEKIMVHKQGEDINGNSLVNKSMILLPWQIFTVYNLIGFYYKGTTERRFKEAFIFIPRKNGKTLFVASLAFGLALLERKSGSKIYVTSASMKQAYQSFEDILYTLRFRKLTNTFKIRDNYSQHSISKDFHDEHGNIEGSIYIEALASNPDAQDSFNCNIAIADEIHAFKKSAQYNRFKEAMKAYTNKLMIGITTAGDNINSFCYGRLEYGVKVVNGTVKDDSIFVFISRADQDEKGNVDYTDPIQHEKANPSYGVTIRPKEIMNDALQAQNDPQQRKDFLSRSLNIYTSALKAWFDIEEFKASDSKFTWTLQELAKLKINWYGGADLSRMYDLTAAALYGHYQDTDIIITHGFFPITQAAAKAEQDNIPLYGWQEDGWLTMCNSPTVNISDIVNWFIGMRNMGFKIVAVGHDRKFAGEEYFPAMKAAGFYIEDQPQYYYLKSQGFRHIEKAAKDGKLYYLHSDAYEYCVSNISAVEKTDDAVQYQKIQPEHRIDLFDASVFACIKYMDQAERAKKSAGWWGN
jgi:phage terminase large subunit-like protein